MRVIQVLLWGVAVASSSQDQLQNRIKEFIASEWNKMLKDSAREPGAEFDIPLHTAFTTFSVDPNSKMSSPRRLSTAPNRRPSTGEVKAALGRRRKLQSGAPVPDDDELGTRKARRRGRRSRTKKRRGIAGRRSGRLFGRSSSDISYSDEEDGEGLDALYDFLEDRLSPEVPPLMQNISIVCSTPFEDAAREATGEFQAGSNSEDGNESSGSPEDSEVWNSSASDVISNLTECNANVSPTLRIGVSLRFFKIVQVDFARGEFAVSLWIRLFWPDLRLLYKGDDFIEDWSSSTDYVPIGVHEPGDNEIWVPYLALVNNMQPDLQETLNYFFPAKVFDTHFLRAKGYNVYWARQMVLSAVCPPHVLMFPFDTQYCPFDFQLWGLNPERFTYAFVQEGGFPPVVESSFPSEAEVWEVDHAIVHPMSETLVGEITNLRYMMAMARDPDYYVSNFVWPLALVTLFGYLSFWLPFQMYDRVALSVTILLAVFAIMYITAASRPPLGQDTWIDVYQAGCIALSLIPAVETIIISRIREQLQRRNQQKEAEWKRLRHSATEGQQSASAVGGLAHQAGPQNTQDGRARLYAHLNDFHPQSHLLSMTPYAKGTAMAATNFNQPSHTVFWQLPELPPPVTITSVSPNYFTPNDEVDDTGELEATFGPRGLWPQVRPVHDYARPPSDSSLSCPPSGQSSLQEITPESAPAHDRRSLQWLPNDVHGSSPPNAMESSRRRVQFGSKDDEDSSSQTGTSEQEKREPEASASQTRISNAFKRLRTMKGSKRIKRAHRVGRHHFTRSLGLVMHPEGHTGPEQPGSNTMRRNLRSQTTATSSRSPQDRTVESRTGSRTRNDAASSATCSNVRLQEDESRWLQVQTLQVAPRSSLSLRTPDNASLKSYSLQRRMPRRGAEDASDQYGLLNGPNAFPVAKPQPTDPTVLPNFIDRMFQILYPGLMLTFFIERFFLSEIQNPLRIFGANRVSVTILAIAVISCLYLLWIFAMASHIMVAFPFSQSHLGYKITDAINVRLERAVQRQHAVPETRPDFSAEDDDEEFRLPAGEEYAGGALARGHSSPGARSQAGVEDAEEPFWRELSRKG